MIHSFIYIYEVIQFIITVFSLFICLTVFTNYIYSSFSLKVTKNNYLYVLFIFGHVSVHNVLAV